MNLIHEPFIQVALPIIITLILAVFLQNKRFDDVYRRLDLMEKRLDEIIRRLERIEAKLDNHEARIAVLEDRTSRIRVP